MSIDVFCSVKMLLNKHICNKIPVGFSFKEKFNHLFKIYCYLSKKTFFSFKMFKKSASYFMSYSDKNIWGEINIFTYTITAPDIISLIVKNQNEEEKSYVFNNVPDSVWIFFDLEITSEIEKLLYLKINQGIPIENLYLQLETLKEEN